MKPQMDSGHTDLDLAKRIAGLAGPMFIAIAASLLLNRKAFLDLAVQMSQEMGLIFLSGILLFLAGIAIVRAHNVWSGGWPVIITMLGWLAIVGGLTRILFFRHAAAIAGSIVQKPGLILGAATVMLLLGVFLTLKGYRLLD